MITATIFNNSQGKTLGFMVKNHGQTHVCAAVSMLVINTANSIEKLTPDTKFTCDWDDCGGFIKFHLADEKQRNTGAGILLDAMVLGLTDVGHEHPNEIQVHVKEVKP